jgi:hypothetical protein
MPAPADDTERTTIFRPNLKDPKLRNSLIPTVPPGAVAKHTPVEAPPTSSKVTARPQPTIAEPALGNESWEEHTHAYAPEVIDKLLNVERPTARPTGSGSAADEATRVGELPIEALVLAQRKATNHGIGFDDKTGVYSLATGAETHDTTSPGTRPKIVNPGLPTIMIREEVPRRNWLTPTLVAAGCAALLAVGWLARGPIALGFHNVQTQLVRGISGKAAPARPAAPAPAAVPATVTIALNVSPPEARVLLDGVQLSNPCSVQRHVDAQPHTLVAEAKGFAPLNRTVHFESDLTIVLALAPLPQAAPEAAVDSTPKPKVSSANPVRAAKARRAEVATEPTAAAAPDCDPPYTLDEAGLKVYKPGCL